METWMSVYASQLEKAVKEHPEEYGFKLQSLPDVLERMRHALKRREYNKDGRAMKATCKALGVKHTYKAINHFLDNHV